MAIGLTVHPPGGGEPRELTFDQQRVRIGRGVSCDLQLPHRAVSSVHAMILLDGDRYFLVDPGSTNGTTLNGDLMVIERRKLLRSGDRIGVASFDIEFRAGVAMLSFHCQDRTAAVARQLARHVMASDGLELRRAALVVTAGPQAGVRFEIPSAGTVTVGRADENQFVVDDREASRQHCALDVTGEGVVVRDLGGKNALLVNERPVQQHRLRDRDELLVGATRLVFDEPVEAYLRELARWPDAPAAGGDQGAADGGGAAARDGPVDPPEGREDEAAEPGGVADEEPQGTSGSGARRETGDRAPSVGGPGDGQRTDPSPPPGPRRGFSAGTEIAIFLVGALALAACVSALVWLFR
jgi:pSer/pThr/pTyr-binding forkhead associated (FHA) protein